MARVYVIGGYLPQGGARMALAIGEIIAKRFGHELIVVNVEKEQWFTKDLFGVRRRGNQMNLKRYHAEVADDDVSVINESFVRQICAGAIKGKKIIYIQHFCTFQLLDFGADLYATVSRWIADLMQHIYGKAPLVIPPYIDLDRIPATTPWGSRPAKLVNVFTKSVNGRDWYWKFYGVCMERLQKALPDHEFLLLSLNKVPQDKFLQEISASRYFLTMSIAEGCPLPHLEAMAMGCTVMGFDSFGGRHYMRDGVNSAVASYPDIDGMVERVRKVLTDDGYAQSLARGSSDTYKQFSFADFERRWLAALEPVLGRASYSASR
jgi:Glycosyl transferases group 1